MSYRREKIQIFQLTFANLFTITFLVIRRRVNAKRRTIVFRTVRPSLQQIYELSKKFQVFSHGLRSKLGVVSPLFRYWCIYIFIYLVVYFVNFFRFSLLLSWLWTDLNELFLNYLWGLVSSGCAYVSDCAYISTSKKNKNICFASLASVVASTVKWAIIKYHIRVCLHHVICGRWTIIRDFYSFID